MKSRTLTISIVIGILAAVCLWWIWHRPVSPKRFWFGYYSQPSPGKRFWSVAGKTWTEKYESGEQSQFKFLKRTTLNGMTGTVVIKLDGAPPSDADGDFQVFIPDKGNPRMELWFRRLTGNQWDEWHSFARMEEVQ